MQLYMDMDNRLVARQRELVDLEAGRTRRWGCEGGNERRSLVVPARGRSAPNQTLGRRPRAALSQPFLAEVSFN